MSDVRLTAINPENSSVVPVACNSKGELLIETPTIERIDNDLEVTGSITTYGGPESAPENVTELVLGGRRMVNATPLLTSGLPTLEIGWNGTTNLRTTKEVTGITNIEALGSFPVRGADLNGVEFFRVDWDGKIYAPEFVVRTESSQSAWKSEMVNGEVVQTYIGKTLNVGEELEFLRAQVQTLKDALNITPSSGEET